MAAGQPDSIQAGVIGKLAVLMSSLSASVLGVLVLATLGFALMMDLLKQLVFGRLEIDNRPI